MKMVDPKKNQDYQTWAQVDQNVFGGVPPPDKKGKKGKAGKAAKKKPMGIAPAG